MPYHPKRPGLDACPVEEMFTLVGGKWKARILLLVALGYETFSDIRAELPGLSTHVLSTQLKAMAADGLIGKIPTTMRNGSGARYATTPVADDLIPVLDLVCAWGLKRLAARGVEWTPPAPRKAARGGATLMA